VLKTLWCVGLVLAGAFATMTAIASAETPATPAQPVVVAQQSPQPTPSPGGFSFSGYYKAYYFTRQNASNNPGVQFNFSPGAKYNSNAVNQASWNQGIQVDGDYRFSDTGWDIGGSYFYANPLNGPCSVAANNAKGKSCVSQVPPNTNPDNTLPGFTESTFTQAYLMYKEGAFYGRVGDQYLYTPWANYDSSRLKSSSYQAGDLQYALPDGINLDVADILQFQQRDASTFSNSTYLTSFPAGSPGMGSNIYYPGGHGVSTPGTWFGKIGYVSPSSSTNPWSVDGYLYDFQEIANAYWGDAKYTWSQVKFHPFVALQGGLEYNTGTSVIGKIDSQLFGIQLGANFTKNIQFTVGFNDLPWHQDQVYLPKGVTCSNTNNTISASGTSFKYFLPMNAAQCYTNTATGLTTIEYGGWASPYTDSTATDPFFTTQMTQGMVDRRNAGTGLKLAATYTSNNHRFVFLASQAWYNYGNTLGAETTNELDLDALYRFSHYSGSGSYRGLVLRERYGQRFSTNTYFPDDATDFGGLPLFKYNRSQIEYDF
jgi:hypothetical protein